MFIAFRVTSVFILLAVALPTFAKGTTKGPGPLTIHIIPQPVSVEAKPGHFTLTANTTIVKEGDSLDQPAAWLAAQLHLQQGKGGKQRIVLHLLDNKAIPAEGYTLTVAANTIRISASSPAGVFYGMQ